MMDDLFEPEQKILDDALLYAGELRKGAAFDLDKFDELAKEYGRLLRQLRRATKLSDRATNNLNTSRIDLQGKVHYDVLTGIYNRRFLEENIGRVMRSLARSGGNLSLIMLDIDYFKKYNDAYGHTEGDACLKAVAEAISGCLLRADDFVARYGGEEFAVVLPNTCEKGSQVMARKISEAVKARNIPHEKSEAASFVTVSAGITTGAVEYGQSGAHYIKRADEALYISKQNGRNQFTHLYFEEE